MNEKQKIDEKEKEDFSAMVHRIFKMYTTFQIIIHALNFTV